MTTPTPIAGIRADLISALIGDAPAANDGLIKSLADSVRDRREHQHNAEDLYCDNLAGWAGDRTASVLRRLLDTEAEVTRLRAELEQARAEATPVRTAAQDEAGCPVGCTCRCFHALQAARPVCQAGCDTNPDN